MDGEKGRSHFLIRQIDKKYLIKPPIDSTKMTGYLDLINSMSSSFASIFLSSKKENGSHQGVAISFNASL